MTIGKGVVASTRAMLAIGMCLAGTACVVRTDQNVALASVRPLRDDVTETTRIAAAVIAGVSSEFDGPGARFRGDTLFGSVRGTSRAIPKTMVDRIVVVRDTVDFDHVVRLVRSDGSTIAFEAPGAVLVRDTLFGVAASIGQAVPIAEVERVWLRRVDGGKSGLASAVLVSVLIVAGVAAVDGLVAAIGAGVR